MKILGHIHTYNDEAVIEESLGALLAQTRALDEIIIVDNGSTDATLEREFPPNVTVVNSGGNLGTSGAVHLGMRYAMENGFDWIWIMDGDSAPLPDALEKLLEFWDGLPEADREQTWRLSSLPLEMPYQAVTTFSTNLAFDDGSVEPKPHHGHVFTETGYYQVEPPADGAPYECDATIWAGCFFRLDAVRRVGLPASDYVVDCGEYEYGYRGKRAQYRAFMDQRSLVRHNIRGQPSFQFSTYRIGPLKFRLIEMRPIRCYYIVRNMLYFWLYEFRPRSHRTLLIQLCKLGALTLNFMVRPFTRHAQFTACLRGFWHAISKNMAHRY